MQEIDFFIWRGIKIYQDVRVHKVGTDAILLGSWIPQVIQQSHRILDAGTGSGILALMMAYYFPEARIKAVDINLQAVGLAIHNINQSGWLDRIIVNKENVFDQITDQEPEFDLIVSNPPFYTTSNPSIGSEQALARHSQVPVGDWMKGLVRRLNARGHLCIIVPAENAMAWIQSANEIAFYIKDRMDVYSFEGDISPVRSLLHFTNKLQKPRFTQMAIYAKPQSYTQEYLEMSGIQPTKLNGFSIQ